MKISVVSNCQVTVMQLACYFLFPEALVEPIFHLGLRDPDLRSRTVDHLRSSDLVFSLNWGPDYGDFAGEGIRFFASKVIFVPELVFGGFHPDITYAKTADGRTVRSPMVDYNSRIAIAGFRAGLGVDRTIGLYNSLVYRRLGYFEAFDIAVAEAKADFLDAGYDISELLTSWGKRGCFMNSNNHPRSFVTTDIMKMICRKEGIGKNLNAPIETYFPDDVSSGGVYPVFPELARPLGLQGSYYFKPPSGVTDYRLHDLRSFVEGSFRMYDGADVDSWQMPQTTRRVIDLIAEMA